MPVTVVVDAEPPDSVATVLPLVTAQVTDWPLIALPAESLATAVACEVPPTVTLALLSVSCTVFTTGVGGGGAP